jgi:phage/plasmid primase-like uncharacterized protein
MEVSMTRQATELAQRLAESADSVCRYYLPNGCRKGRYWLVGDTQGSKGQSLYVRLAGEGCGRWTDAATGERGDLLDLIRLNQGHLHFRDTLVEARRFLNEPQPASVNGTGGGGAYHQDNPEAAQRLWRYCKPIAGSLAERYLRHRGIIGPLPAKSLRFQPRLFYRADDEAPVETWPAMVAAVTDIKGEITGAHRTWLARDGLCKAPIENPRKALGCLYGHAVRFGVADPVMAAGEGLETVLSVRAVMPALSCMAALSAAHLAVLHFPDETRRLYILADNDEAGRHAAETLSARAASAGIETHTLMPQADDFNTDLAAQGRHALAAWLAPQLVMEDAARFLR